MLDSIAYIAKKLQNVRYENHEVTGTFYNLSQDDIDNLVQIWEYVLECEYLNKDYDVNDDKDLDKCINHDIKIKIETGDIKGYFDTFASFLIKNKVKLNQCEFYIRDIDCLYKNGKPSNERLNCYFQNIKLINLLRKIVDYEKEVGNDLELFFYKAEKGLVLNIDYDKNDLNDLVIYKLNELENHFFDMPDKEERKQIFINDLINLLSDDNSYNTLLKKWDTLQGNYEKSFKLYLSGFSFEKIKTASISYFQELTDRIYDQINKATTNIFIVPSAYMFFIGHLEVSGDIFRSVLLLITTFIFSLIMHKVLFSNMTDGLAAINKDIERFMSKANTNLPEEIEKELNELKNTKIQKQDNKIKLLKWINWLLFIMFSCRVVYTVYG